MKKEVVIALSIGFLFGLLVIGGYYFIQIYNHRGMDLFNPLLEEYQQESPAIKFANQSTHLINLVSPADQLLTNQDTTAVVGITTPLSYIVILYEKGESLIKADENGNFNLEIPLIGGENDITLKAYSPSGLLTEKKITLVFSTVEI